MDSKESDQTANGITSVFESGLSCYKVRFITLQFISSGLWKRHGAFRVIVTLHVK